MDLPYRDPAREQRYRDVFQAVYEPLQRFVRRRATADVVDDVVADALLVAWRRLDDIPRGAELPWCYGVARRCLANERRAEARRLGLVERLESRTDRSAAADVVASADSVDAALADALDTLPDDDRAVLQLWAWEDLAPREIAVVLGISANAASIRLHRAKRRLKSLLESGKTDPGAGHQVSGQEGTPR